MTAIRKLGRALALAFLFAAPLAARAADKPRPPIESFFENAAFGGARLSPSGRYLAALVGGNGHRDWLVVVDLQTNEMKRVAAYSDADVGQFQWVNDERLAYSLTDKQVGPGDVEFAPGLFAVNRDGSKQVQLAARRGSMVTALEPGRKLLPWHTYLLGQDGAQDSDWIYVYDPEFDRMTGRIVSVRLLHLNTITGRAMGVNRPGLVSGWMLDHQGEPRLAISSENTIVTLHYRDPANGEWRKLASYDHLKTGEAIDPVGFGPDGTLYVTARKDQDMKALYTVDLRTGALGREPVMVT
ncbi:MAG TPA: S9 family peptidase, partial [Telluria sp.]|nr:S9 family peptidase [Telluria sp.]